MLLSTAVLLCLLGSCGDRTKKSSGAGAYSYNPFVEGFTSGNISRFTPVCLILNQSIPADRQDPARLKKHVRISPSAQGELAFENDRTIVFRPAESGLKRNITYTVTADLSEWIDTGREYKTFTFNFTTHPLALRASFESIGTTDSAEGFTLESVVLTPDSESAETVESLVKFSEKVNAAWEHSGDGRHHTVVISGVMPQDKKRDLVMSVAPNKLNVAVEPLLTMSIPGINDFAVYNVVVFSEPSRYVEVTFTEQLDESQDLRGIAYIEDNESEVAVIENNKIRLYPDSRREGVMNIFLGGAIRSKSGLRLGEDIVRQVNVNTVKPSVRFAGEGVIIPMSDKLSVPFQAVNLRGVVVKVIRIFENNVGQFLQENSLDGSSNLTRVGRLIARKVIFLEEDGVNLSDWNTFAVDLMDMVKPEPGAIYRVELSFNKDLSAYPCDDTEIKSREQITADNEASFREELARFDGGYYYSDYYDNPWMYEYSYSQRDNPCDGSYFYYNSSSVGRNIMASNLGLIAKRGDAGEMIVLVHNIVNTQPEAGVEVVAYNFQNQPIGKGVTDASGRALIYPTGKPHHIAASQGSQRGYMHVNDGNALSMSSFDVSGAVVQRGIKGFIYGERGVWRPGDTIHLGFMLNDRSGKLPGSHPVTLELYNPLGQLYTTVTQAGNEMGLYTFAVQTEADAPTGAWNAHMAVGGVQFTKTIRVETIKPNRLKIDLRVADSPVVRKHATTLNLHTEWLQGATARNLDYDIEATLTPVTTRFDKFPGYTFDNPAGTYDQEPITIAEGQMDGNGNAEIRLELTAGENAPGMMTMSLFTRVHEDSGNFSIDGTNVPYSPYTGYVGIVSPQSNHDQLNTGTSYIYDIVTLSYDGKPAANVDVDIEVYKGYWYWWWSSSRSDIANYVSNSYNKPVKNFSVKTKSDGKASFNLQFGNNEWGTYIIMAKNRKTGHVSGVVNYYDWPYNYGRRDIGGSDNATRLSFKTDKEAYEPGETMTVVFPSSKGSRAVVSIENGTKVLSINEHVCTDGETTVQIPVTEDMQPNAYVHITLLQPHGATVNDLPIRLYGVVPFTVTSPRSFLHPVIGSRDEIRPEADYEISVSEKTGRPMAYTLAVVDEGLLDLTKFRTPDPWSAFNAREALGVNTWDMYKYVMGAYGGRIERIFSIGGDDEGAAGGSRSKLNRFTPVVEFHGPFLLGKGETRRHAFKMPNYNGRVRVMVVAGDGEAYGNAEKSVMVRKPVMLLGTLPRVIGLGEEMAVPATVFATEKGVGRVRVTIETSKNMSVSGASVQELYFDEIGDKSAMFRITVGRQPGTGTVRITAEGRGEKTVYETDIEIRAVHRPQVKVIPVVLEPGASWKETVKLPGKEGTNSLSLEVSDIQPVNLTSRLDFLIGYPHGCIEQITSKGFPQLYLSQFTTLTPQQQTVTQESVKEVINRMRSYQNVDGAFSYWPGGSTYYSWATVYATHFLHEAGAKGYLVPDALKRNAIRNMTRTAKSWKPSGGYDSASEEHSQAYRLYVLALTGNPELGAMNRLKENEKLNEMTRWTLAAAYAKAGRADVAKTLIQNTRDIASSSTQYDFTFGSDLRNKAMQLMTLCAIGEGTQAGVLANEISGELGSDRWMSTQETAFCLMAMTDYMKLFPVGGQMSFGYKSDSKGETVRTSDHVWKKSVFTDGAAQSVVEFRNDGKSAIFARIITEGTPDQGTEEAYANNLSINVRYYDDNGTVNDREIEQGVTFTAEVRVKNTSARGLQNLVITQIIPAGWEIVNKRFLDEENTDDSGGAGISYQDIRDDRAYSYVDFLPSGTHATVSLTVTAAYAGRFYLPPVYCEAMYDNLTRANTEGVETVVK